MKLFFRVATQLGLIKAKIPKKIPFIAIYTLLILDHLMRKVTSLEGIKEEINTYPEDTHREGFVCKGMSVFVAEFPTFELLKQGIEQQFDNNGGRSGAESHRDSMERLESNYDE